MPAASIATMHSVPHTFSSPHARRAALNETMDPEFLSSDDEEFDVIFDDDDEELNDIELFQQRSNGTVTRGHCIA